MDDVTDVDSDVGLELLHPPVPFGHVAPLRALYPLKHHQLDFDQLQASNAPEPPLTLNSLNEGEVPNYPPPHTVTTIIKCAILGSPKQRLTLKELRIALRRRFHYYANTDSRSWCNTLRYYLSSNEDFVRVVRQRTVSDMGAWWTLHKIAAPPDPLPSTVSYKKSTSSRPKRRKPRKKTEAQERPLEHAHSPYTSRPATGDVEISELHMNPDKVLPQVVVVPATPCHCCHLSYSHPPGQYILSLPSLNSQQHPLEEYTHGAYPMASPLAHYSHRLLSQCVLSQRPLLSYPPSPQESRNNLPSIRDLGLLDFGRDGIYVAPASGGPSA